MPPYAAERVLRLCAHGGTIPSESGAALGWPARPPPSLIRARVAEQEDCDAVLKYHECFSHRNHLCLVSELLACNL